MQTKKHFIIPIFLIILCSFTFVSCGENGDGTPSAGISTGETINAIAVPPEPDMTENNATLAGVDSNNNSVRDDVERLIAQTVKTQNSFDKSLVIAQNLSLLATQTGVMQSDQITLIYKNVGCYGYEVYQESGLLIEEVINNQIFNTDARRAALEKATATYGGAEFDANECN